MWKTTFTQDGKELKTPLVSFEDLRPYLKLLVKNWWMLLGLPSWAMDQVAS